MVGEQVERRPELAARIASAGHLVALHGYRHRLQLRMRARAGGGRPRAGGRGDRGGDRRGRPLAPAAVRDLQRRRATGRARGRDCEPLLWSRWGKDWRKFTTPARIAARATRDLGPGDVILLHDADFYSARHSHRRTAEALPAILTELKRRGLGTVLPV